MIPGGCESVDARRISSALRPYFSTPALIPGGTKFFLAGGGEVLHSAPLIPLEQKFFR